MLGKKYPPTQSTHTQYFPFLHPSLISLNGFHYLLLQSFWNPGRHYLRPLQARPAPLQIISAHLWVVSNLWLVFDSALWSPR